MNGNGYHEPREEILECVWRLEEEGAARFSRLLERLPEAGDELTRLERAGLISMDGDDLILSERGRGVARHVVRANRLAARLMADVLELSPAFVEQQACRLEHAIGANLADSLCTFLGHPPTAPDGRAIPPGPCCSAAPEGIKPAVVPLSDLRLGQTCKVTFIRPGEKERLAQLTSLGINPGAILQYKQKRPSVVVNVGETTLALDDEIARNIFVKPVESPETGGSTPY